MTRVVHPVEQESFRRLRASPDTSHSAAPHAGAPVVADVEMVAAGITKRRTVGRLKGAKSRAGLTRSAHAIRLAYEEVGPGALWAIGLPAGFAGAAESKAALNALLHLPAPGRPSPRTNETTEAIKESQ